MITWRVLVADDDLMSLHVIRDSLADLPIALLEARDGEEVVRLAKSEGPDLILLDVMMPRLDGFQVAALLKQDPATAEIPVIFISAMGSPKDKVRGLKLGAEDYLAKPIHPEEVRARVLMVLRRVQPSKRGVPLASGQLEAMNLLSLVQLFEGERRTARLLLTRGSARGEIVFENGKIAQAAQGIRKGKAAVYQLLTWRAGTFQVASPETSRQVGGMVDAPTQALLLEGLRRLDEIPGLRASLSDPVVRMEVEGGLRATIQTQARPEARAVVALLDGTRDLDRVLAQSPLDEWATLRILHLLRRAGVLVLADTTLERRGGARLTVDVPVHFQSLRSFQQSTAFSLSALGAFIRTPAPLEMGEQVALRFQLPGHATWVNVVGQVVWQNTDPAKAGGVGMGIRFVDITASDREAVEGYVAQSLAGLVSLAGEK